MALKTGNYFYENSNLLKLSISTILIYLSPSYLILVLFFNNKVLYSSKLVYFLKKAPNQFISQTQHKHNNAIYAMHSD